MEEVRFWICYPFGYVTTLRVLLDDEMVEHFFVSGIFFSVCK